MADVRRLPVPVTAIWDWQMRAACRDIDSAMFFHPENERGPAKHTRDTHAKRVCARCPVIEACRRHALSVQEPYGVWGGLTVAERDAILLHQAGAHRSGAHRSGARFGVGDGDSEVQQGIDATLAGSERVVEEQHAVT